MSGVVRDRPGPVRWLWYAIGGRLPDRFRHWVLWDLTCRTWVFRHLARSLVLLAPWWLLMLVPGPLSLRFSMVTLAYITGLYFAMSFMEHASERRLVKHGYPAGLNRRIREEAEPHDRAEVVAMYAAYHDQRYDP
ncbi:hypothetical protein SAMN05192558_11026 [Actinokineospora alba]|uniref:DUF5313 domain-containing protein n=1 Tax=Actinokineospora alba TaxID=504798 RepID=A0A1H0TJQ3_9PSEU|nr:DUF5313 family protein [Actinokineospora alba]TDP70557.1 hypothetical protein C8E96_6176 [Actinokineospora alba]SDJ09985.1 hypothetical protein SAMN05421871_11026 [Actinokineospora alba]SDP54224.1 hypothetical protein SAMN05192558_11026 [Actinokineospora alba]